MSIGQRIARLFRSWRAQTADMDELSERLDETYRTQSGLLQQVRRGVADVATSRKRVELQLAALRQQAAQLDAEASQAVARGDDEAARSALTRKVTLERSADDLQQRHATLKSEEDQLLTTASQIERQVEEFRLRKDTLTARHSAATARAEVNSATGGISSSMSEISQAMESAERHTRELEATADAVDELIADGLIAQPGETAAEAEARRFDAALAEGDTDGPDAISR